MPIDRAALMQRLMASFQEEAAERLAILESELLRWQADAPEPDSLEAVFREVHSLKGATRAVGLHEPEQICHAWEAVLQEIRQGKRAFLPAMVTGFQAALQFLKRCHAGEALSAGQFRQAMDLLAQTTVAPHPASASPIVATPTVAAVETTPPAPHAPAATLAERPATWRGQTLRVRAEQGEQLAYYGEALRQHRMTAHNLHRRSHGLQADFQRLWQRRLRHEGLLSRLRSQLAQGQMPEQEALRSLLEWQDWSLDLLATMQVESHGLRQACQALDRDMGSLSEAYTRTVDELLLLPCRSMLDELPAMVGELAAQTGKQAELLLPQTGLQVDKRILDALRTPLMHLLRNALDHGIEPPAVRAANGKPALGRLQILLHQTSASHFSLTLTDDGGGIDRHKLQQKAEETGLLAAGSPALPDAQLLPLVFESGITTSSLLTTLSGRGEGLAIVREAMEQLGGSISVDSTPGQGCRFTLQLPLSRSTFRVMLVRLGEQRFAIPAHAVGRALRLPLTALHRQESGDSVMLDGLSLPLRPLAQVLALAPSGSEPVMLNLLLLGSGEQQIALLVDELLGDQEITLKPLGRQLRRVRNLLGATVLGDGSLVPVLHPQDLYRSCLQAHGPWQARPREEQPRRQARILVVDDSFTSRGLLRALLETAGYAVQTANDGLEAWNTLRQHPFDLLVSDIEMPRMDGFTLTARLRADPNLAKLPVVLVTALHTAEDKARGLEVGANAYLVKGGLETDTVLAAVNRLL
ncbi:hybrid sensor histidine kinase/response regulator [Chitinimonas prasina]|uniref:histidine kinase n=2 Tax=Chitinimonas prasina TaxID=1434937 RepID=A0ABQ5YEB7_9NEIS|nr:hybrid sensor histidine kinase/response regulator [Chitinimonas prasina]